MADTLAKWEERELRRPVLLQVRLEVPAGMTVAQAKEFALDALIAAGAPELWALGDPRSGIRPEHVRVTALKGGGR